MSKPKLFVTGGSGFLGSHIVRMLVKDGYTVKGLVYEKDRIDFVRGLGAEPVPGGFDDIGKLASAMVGCKGLFHIAGYVSVHDTDPTVSRKINVDGTRAVFEAARQAGISRAVHTSSIVGIGATQEKRVIDETFTWNLGGLKFPYADTKRAGEQLALSYNGQGIETVVVNPGGMLGPEDYFRSEASQILREYLLGRVKMTMSVRNSWVDVRDVARGHILAFEKGKAGERYILSNENSDMATITAHLDEIFGLGRPKVNIGWPVTYILGSLLEKQSKRAALTRQHARYFRLTEWVSSDKARRELGYTTRPIKETLREAGEWYREYHLKDRAKKRVAA